MTEVTGKLSHALMFEMMSRPHGARDFEVLMQMFRGRPDNLEKFLSWLDRRELEIRKKL